MVNQDDTTQVKETINFYANGAINRDFDFLAKGWHEECKMMGVNPEGKLSISDISFWKDAFSKPIDDPQYKRISEILEIDITGIAASAKVKTVVDSSNGRIIFIDYLNLLKINNKWWIVNKIYNAQRIPK